MRSALLVLAAVGLIAILLEFAGVGAGDVGKSFVEGLSGYSFSRGEFIGWGPASEVLRRMAPLVLTGLAVYLALQAGLFNIGAEGQLMAGGLAAAFVGSASAPLGFFGAILAIVAGLVAGLAWALPAALLKVCRGGHEVISTIMLNNIAAFVATFLIAGPMRDRGGQEAATAMVSDALRLQPIGVPPGVVLLPALLFGVVACAALGWWLYRTASGFELRSTGAGPRAALFAGVPVRRYVGRALCASGAIAGLGGALHLLGQEGKYTEGFSPGFGFDSLGVAMLAGKSPLGVLPAAALFASIDQGALRAQVATGLPKEVSAVLQGLIILLVAVVRYRRIAAR
jgi:simple sugar transport system permease protein